MTDRASRTTARNGLPRGPAPRRLKLDLSFVGTRFRGWQSQAKGKTGQDALEAAFRSIQIGASKPAGCSRTDSGVHARRFCAHADVTLRRSCEQVAKGLNAELPSEIRVHRVSAVSSEFHARYACEGKTYKYFLYLEPVAPPALAPYLWVWQGPLDIARMAKAAFVFEGEHDFSLFTTAEGRERQTTRAIASCRAEQRGPLCVITVEGPSFLHRMVRCIAGALAAIGSGRLSEAELRLALQGKAGGTVIHALPSQALHLWDVRYPTEEATETYGDWPKPPSWVLEDCAR